jgi:hypothetical protein
MLKRSLFIGTFFLLFIGLSDYGYGCHRGERHGPNGVPCDTEPPPDDGGNKGIPVVVTFDDFETDSIQSDHVGKHDKFGKPLVLQSYEHEESKTGVLAILDGGFFMNMRAAYGSCSSTLVTSWTVTMMARLIASRMLAGKSLNVPFLRPSMSGECRTEI